MLIKKLVSIFLLMNITFISAQHLNFEQISLEQGLSNSLVNSILQDKQGFIWIGTESGLNKFDGYNFKVFNTDPDNPFSIQGRIIKNLFEDSKGLIWISFLTGGLSYYDPKTEKFLNFLANKNLKDGLSDNIINTIFEDRRGNVWIGTNNGLNKFERKNNTFYHYFNSKTNPNSIINNEIITIYEDKRGSIWIGTRLGLSIYNYKTNNFLSFIIQKSSQYEPDTLSGNSYTSIIQDKKGSYWIGTRSHGVFYCNSFPKNANDFKAFNAKSIYNVDYILESPGGVIWIAHSHGLSLIEQKSISNYKITNLFHSSDYRDFNGDSRVSSLKEDSKGNMWVALEGNNFNLFRIDKNLQIESVSNQKSYKDIVKNKNVLCLFEDKFGVMWIGLEKGGIVKCDLNGKPFEKISLTDKNELPKDVVYSIYVDLNETCWIGTANGLVRLNKEGNNIKRYTQTIGCKNCPAGKSVATISQDKKGYIWLGFHDSQISRFDPKTEEFTNFIYDPLKSASNVGWAVRKIIPDLNGDLWFSSFSAGLTKMNVSQGNFFNYSSRQLPWKNANAISDSRNHLVSNYITCMLADGDTIIWIGSLSEGLDKFNLKTKSFEHFKKLREKVNTISSNEISSLYRSQKGQLWIGTGGGGLCLMNEKEKTFIHYTVKNGLSNNTITGITEDTRGFLWLSTVNGISCFDPLSKVFHNFSKEDGLETDEFNSNAIFKTKDGKVYLGGNNGIIAFFPEKIINNPFKPNAVITGFRIYNRLIHAGDTLNKHTILNQAINYTEKLTLKYDEDDITFEFAALHYAVPKKNKLKYKLEGYDKEWKYTDYKELFATYTKLPAGKYVFKVMAGNNDGIWSDKEINLQLEILPPWWETVWFKSMVIFILTGAVLFAYRQRIKNLQRRQIILENKIELRTQHLKNANEEIGRQKDEIITISEKLHDADNIKINFFTNISHEFRTPLTIILSTLSKLQKAETGKTFSITDDYGMINRNALRLLKLTNQLLDFRKIDQELYKIKVEETVISDFISNLISEFIPLSAKSNIDLIFQVPDSPVIGFIDRDCVEKILFNLLSNAIKYTPDGGKIVCALSVNHQTLQINIIDTGIGVSRKDIPYLFDRFFEVKDKNFQRFESTGLGLAFAKQLAFLHKGDIKVISEPGKGSTFTVTLSISRENFDLDEISSGEIENSILPILSVDDKNVDAITFNDLNNSEKPLLLIAEDNQDLRLLITQEMEQEYRIIVCTNGLSAYEQAQLRFPDAILSDIMMPGMDGIELCRNIKSFETTSHIPVILLTARSSTENIIEGLDTGADDYISKPFNIDILKARLRNIIIQRKKLRGQFINEPEKDIITLANNKTDLDFINRLTDIIEAEINNPDLDGDYLAKALGISKSGLYKKVNALADVSINIFIRNYRLKKSLELIKNSDSNISEIAYQLGFNSPGYFSRCFSEYFGFAPTKVKRQ